jgi:hypothetical protein
MYVFDIFSKPFILKVERGEENKKTNFGGTVTLLILFTAVAYFISILITFFERENPPSVTTSRLINLTPT